MPYPGRSLTVLHSILILNANLPDSATRDSIDACKSLIGVNRDVCYWDPDTPSTCLSTASSRETVERVNRARSAPSMSSLSRRRG